MEKVKFASSGYPDRIYFGYGTVVLIEYKRIGEEPERLQEYRINELRKRGITAEWADDSDDAIRILQAKMDAARLSGQWD